MVRQPFMTYDQQNCPPMNEFAFETFLDDPSRCMDIKCSKNLGYFSVNTLLQ